MEWFTKGITALILVFFIVMLGKSLQKNPELLSKANLSKSFYTMGIVAVGLIAFVAFLVLMLRGA